MAPTKIKFRLSRIVVSAAVFISLCGVRSAAESRRCYWCGPLAEQVHRSQRALPCGGANTQVTVCDPGFPYCAVVATSPPYIESRYCVKLYQDECYTLYCNSTRTWRMTCPCRGDLCNGPNTAREDDAFTGLARIVAKTHNTRIKRALITTSGFINMMNTNTRNRIDNTTVEENKNISNNNTDNGEMNSNNETQINANPTADVLTQNMETQSGTITSVAPDDKKEETQNNGNTSPANIELKNTEVTTKNPNNDADTVTKNNEMDKSSIQIEIHPVSIESSDLKTEIILMSSESPKNINDAKTSNIENVPNVETTTEMMVQTTMAETTTKTTTIIATELKMVENKMKPNEQLPTAEALQHNDTPTIKSTEQTTTMSTTTMTIQHIEVTTEPSKTRNNTAVRIDSHILTLAIGVILQYL